MSECNNLSKSIQDLSNKIDRYQESLKNRLNNFEIDINNLKKKVAALDQDIKNIIPRVNSHESRLFKLERRSFGSNSSRNKDDCCEDIQKLKKDVAAIERYINILDKTGNQIISILSRLAKVFSLF
ncbi:MAG: hypothetical protein AAF349_00280 [Cyanobacteria bacterium P01_A01_bin.68]